MDEIYLPLDIIRNSPGFAIDIGCSIGKLVYRPKSLYKNGEIISQEKVKKKLGPVYHCLFKCNDLDGLTKIIHEECDFSAKPGQEVSVVGVGCTMGKERLEEALNVKLKMEMEFDVGVDALSYLLEHISPEEIFLPEPPGAREGALQTCRLYKPWVTGFEAIARSKWEMGQDEEEVLSWKPDASADIYPYLLVGLGSQFTLSKVGKDGSLLYLGPIYFGGRCTAGLLASLTGEKDFDKLIKMAEESNGRTTDLYGSDLFRLHQLEEFDPTNESEPDIVILPFGRAATYKGEVKKGDMVHSVLESTCMNVALTAQSVALANGCKHVFFVGNFIKPPLLHKWLSREMIRRNMECPAEKRVDFRFIRHGGQLSNIGAFIQGARNQTDKKL